MFIPALLTTIALFAPASPNAPAIRSQLESTLAKLADAATRGDEKAYLALVHADHDEFLHEQEYFARELGKHPPKSASFTIAEGDITTADHTATAPITLTWSYERPSAKPDEPPTTKEKSVSFPAIFTRTDAGEWKFSGEAWFTTTAPGVIVMYEKGQEDIAKVTAEAFAAIRPGVEASFGLADSEFHTRVQRIKLYSTMAHLQASIALSYTDPLSGWNEPAESMKILPSGRSSVGSMKTLLAHEFGHVATFAMGVGSRSAPWWVLEGAAELAAEPFQRRPSAAGHGEARMLLGGNGLAPWADVADFEHTSGANRSKVYAQGRSMLIFINDRFGQSGRNAWLRALASGRDLNEASTETLGLTFDELDEAWRAMLAGK